jgi:hypothetical protein
MSEVSDEGQLYLSDPTEHVHSIFHAAPSSTGQWEVQTLINPEHYFNKKNLRNHIKQR